MGRKLTKKQVELGKLVNQEMIRKITRNKDKAIRDRAKVIGTYEWAVCISTGIYSSMRDDEFNDEFCQKLIDIIFGGPF